MLARPTRIAGEHPPHGRGIPIGRRREDWIALRVPGILTACFAPLRHPEHLLQDRTRVSATRGDDAEGNERGT
jgi:hypothetical protein